MRKTILLSILLCASATLAQVGNIVPYTAPPISMPTPAPPGATLSTPGLTPLQRSEVQVRDMLEQNQRRNLQNQMSQTTQQQQENTRQMEQSGQAIGEGLEHLAHGGGAERERTLLQGVGDFVDGVVELAQLDDEVARDCLLGLVARTGMG